MTPAHSSRTAGPAVQTLVLEDFPRPEMARLLSPNGRAHWTQKRRARLYVTDQVTVAAIRAGLLHMSGLVTLSLRYVYPVERVRDQDNATTGVTKALLDTLVKGLLLDGDDTTHLKLAPVEVVVEKGARRLELRFEVGEQ